MAGGENKVVEASRGLKSTSPLPQQLEPSTKEPPGNKVEINATSIDYVESAALKQKKDLSSAGNAGMSNKIFENLNLSSTYILQFLLDEAAMVVAKSSQRGHKRDRPLGDGGSGSDSSSLEESVEEYKQPQTEEIMNAELMSQVKIKTQH